MATTPQDRELHDAILDAESADQDYLEAEGRRKKAREALVALLRLREENEVHHESDGVGWKVRVVAAERTKIHDDVLVGLIGRRAYNRLTERKVSKDKLMAAMHSGELDPVTVAPAVEISTNAAWPKIDRYVPETEETEWE